MRHPSKRLSLSNRLRYGFVAAACVSVVLLVAQLIHSGHQADRLSVERQATTAITEIEEMFADLRQDQMSVTIWDDAVKFTAVNYDFTWVWENIGAWMSEYYGVNRVYVLDGNDKPLYSFVELGKGLDGGLLPPTIVPLAAELRARIESGEELETIQVGDVVEVYGRTSYVTLAPIIPYSDRIVVPEKPTVQVLVQYLDTAFVSVGSNHRFVDARFSKTNTDPSFEYVPIPDPHAHAVGYFAWRPYLPGHGIIMANLPLLACASLALLGFALYLSRDLGRMSTNLQAGQAIAHRQARQDHLTGMPNRLALAEAMQDQAKTGSPVAIAYVDVDNFKNVNDALGHSAGDDLIKVVAHRLIDALGDSAFEARVGGDEFAVLANKSQVQTIASTIVACIRPVAKVSGLEMPITASVGLACSEDDVTEPAELLRRADIALYKAKLSGRDCFKVFETAMDEDARSRRALESDLRRALGTGDQLRLVFQPLFDKAGRIVGVESLVRWHHPSLGELPPPLFVKIAEEAGMIAQLGEWILEQACRHAVTWNVDYIAVNVSALQFRTPGFVGLVADVLARTGLAPERLELELTENVLADNSVTGSVAELRAMGISIALDDFGTGFSSLNYLRQFPVDKIKVDRSFVQEATREPGAKAIVSALVQLAQALDLEITAEGVETEEQRQMLVDLGCHQLQGYLMSRPISPEALSDLLAPSRQCAA